MEEYSSIQWFPGHMAKTRRIMRSNLALVDIVVEIIDARIPISSRNPEIDKIIGKKPRVLLFNKSDNADEAQNKAWCDYFAKHQIPAIPTDCRSGRGLKAFDGLVKSQLADLLQRRAARGMQGRPIRLMIVGIPNVGKSSLINRLANSKRTKVEDRPGVTRNKQWVKLNNGMELLDMPGVLWPKFEDKRVGEYLAFTGAVKDEVFDIEHVASRLCEVIYQKYPQLLSARYGFSAEEAEGLKGYELLTLIGKKRGMLIAGGEINTERAAITVLDEFRSGKIGRITLETPEKPQ